MKNLKKLISVIIAVIMLVSSFATVAAADYADVESTNSYYKAIKVLSGLGIAQGDGENFNPKNDVKRSEMVAFVCRAMGEEDIATASSSNAFTDVAANHWAAGYIAWGVNRGIINGMGDGTFAPDASVTYQDAVVMIMRALGYDRIAQRAENGGYPTGYLKLASQYGVLKDAGYDNAKAATREIIAQLIYNALTAPLVDVSYYGVNVEDDRYIIYNGKNGYDLRTLLTFSNEVMKFKANITATPKSDSALIDKNGNYKVTLNLVSDYAYDGELITDIGTSTPTVYVGETEAAGLLGSTVEAYIAESEELNDYVLLAVVADAKSTVEETVAAADVDFVSYTSNVFTYLDDNDKEVEIKTVAAPTVYFNGKQISGASYAANLAKIQAALSVTVADTEDLLLNVADKVTFMGPKNGDYDKIFVTDYSYAKVVEVMADELFIKVEINGTETAIDLDVENRTNDKFVYNLFDAKGNAIELADVAEDDILNIVAPLTSSAYDVLASGLDYMDIYVSNETVTGRVDEYITGSKYVIADNTYVVLTSVTPGDEGVFYLTIDGKVYDADADSTISKDYAFVVAHDTDSSFGVTTHTLRVFKADGTFENLTIAPSVNVYIANPDNSYTYEKVVAKRSDGKQDTLGAYLDGFLVDYAAASESTGDKAAAKEWVADALQARVMTYSLNAEGEIKEMRFAGTGSDQFAALEVDGAKYYDDTAVFAGNDLDDKSVLFVAPIVDFVKLTCTTDHAHTAGAGNGCYKTAYKVDEDKLEVSSFDLMDEDKVGGYDAYVFNFENDEFLGAAIVGEEITSSMKFAHLAVVQAKSTGLDAEGDTIDKYTLVQGGEVLSLDVDSDYAYAGDLQAGTAMAAGDVIRYTVDADGEIDSIEHIYDASAETFATAYAYSALDTNDIAIVYGNISEIKAGKMTLSATGVGGAIAGADVPGTKLAFNTTEGNTYASIDEARVQGTVAPNTGVKALAGAGNLRASYGTTEFYVVAIVGENNRFEDCVMIIK